MEQKARVFCQIYVQEFHLWSFFQVSHILEVKEIERRIKQGEELLMLLITCL
jgi:hypothetical protein